MIKINLLPKSIHEKRLVKIWALVFLAVIVGTVVGGVTYKMKLDRETAEMADKANYAESEKARIAQINQNAQAELGKIAPIQAKLKFIQDVQVYNTVMPQLYQELAKYTYKGVLYRKVTPSATGLQIDGYTPSLSDLGRYLLNMYKADSIFSSVSISAIPGYPAAQGVSVVSGGGYPGGGGGTYYPGMPSEAARYGGLGAVTSGVSRTIKEKGFNFSVACTLKTPIAAPAPPAGGAAAATAGGTPGTPYGAPAAVPSAPPPPPAEAMGGGAAPAM